MKKPFILCRKSGKLPFDKISVKYDLEYGQSEVEMHTDAIVAGQRVLIHDDLLATGGTAMAATELCKKLGGIVHGYLFIIELGYLSGRAKLEK